MSVGSCAETTASTVTNRASGRTCSSEISELHVRPEARFVTVEAVVSAQDPTLNPDHLVAALHQLAPELAPDFAAFTRQEVYTEDMQIFR